MISHAEALSRGASADVLDDLQDYKLGYSNYVH